MHILYVSPSLFHVPLTLIAVTRLWEDVDCGRSRGPYQAHPAVPVPSPALTPLPVISYGSPTTSTSPSLPLPQNSPAKCSIYSNSNITITFGSSSLSHPPDPAKFPRQPRKSADPNPLKKMPNLVQERVPGQTVELPLEREVYTIPRARTRQNGHSSPRATSASRSSVQHSPWQVSACSCQK